MTFQPIGLAVMIATLGGTVMTTGVVAMMIGLVTSDSLPFDRSTELLWATLAGVGIGKIGMEIMELIPNLDGGLIAWFATGLFTGSMILLIMSALLFPVGIVDSLLGGESFATTSN